PAIALLLPSAGDVALAGARRLPPALDPDPAVVLPVPVAADPDLTAARLARERLVLRLGRRVDRIVRRVVPVAVDADPAATAGLPLRRAPSLAAALAVVVPGGPGPLAVLPVPGSGDPD